MMKYVVTEEGLWAQSVNGNWYITYPMIYLRRGETRPKGPEFDEVKDALAYWEMVK